jgi:hypothetical protein
MSFALIPEVWASRFAGNDKLVLLRLADYADDSGRSIFPSVPTVARTCGLSVRTVQRAIMNLKAAGVLLEVEPAKVERSMPANYRIDRAALRENAIIARPGVRLAPAPRKFDTSPGVKNSDTLVPDCHHPGVTLAPNPTNEPIKVTEEDTPAIADDVLAVAQHPLLEICGETPADQHTDAVTAWNALATDCGLAAVQSLTEPRRRQLAARLKECGGIDGWHFALSKVRTSPFLRGQGSSGWRADFDFMLRPKNFTKLMEGGYDPAPRGGRNGTGYSLADAAAEAQRILRGMNG